MFRFSALLLLASVIALSGCDTAGSNNEEEEYEGGGEAPALAIDETSYDYGFVHVGTPQSHTFTISNNGAPPPDSVDRDGALIGNVRLSMGDEADGAEVERFSIESGEGEFDLLPGDSLNVVVEFNPAVDRVTSQAFLTISNNASDTESPLFIPLEGDGVAFEGGSGQANDPYQITRPDQLQVINNGLREEDFVLVDDVDAAVTRDWNEGDGFIPIGERADGERFIGTFDGAGHVISDLWIRRSDTDGVGVFAALGPTILRDVTLRGIEITGGSQTGGLVGQNAGGTIEFVDVAGTVNGNVSVGGAVGLNFGGGTIQSAESGASVQGESLVGGLVGRNRESTIRTATMEGAVEGTGPPGEVGGLVGRNAQGEILTSSVRGNVSSSGDRGQVGGLVGRNVGGVIEESSYADGTVEALVSAGGLVGANFAEGIIQASTASGTVLSDDRGGGLVGRNAVKGQILNSSATTDVEADRNAGGLVGLNREQVRGCWADGAVQGGTNVGGLAGTNLGAIEASYAHGTVDGDTRVGGLVGRGNGGTLLQSYAVGSVSGASEVGGLVGRQDGSEVTSSYWDTNATEQNSPTGSQNNASVDATGLPTNQMTGTAAVDNMSGLDFTETWTPVSNGYPDLQWE